MYHHGSLQFGRKKFETWTKKLNAHEQLQVEFEIASDSNPDLEKFSHELAEKISTMLQFKKEWMKFQTNTDTYIKRDVALHDFVVQKS